MVGLDIEGLTVAERVDNGDRYAVYDWVVNSIEQLELVRDALGDHLADGDRHALVALRALHTQETAGSDAGWKERQRSRSDRSVPASHG